MSIVPPKPIKLYSNKSCPWAQRARIALLETGVKYEEIEIDLQNKPEWYWKINPLGKVPALDFGGNILIESVVITEFIVDLFRDAGLFPFDNNESSALNRARAKQFVELFNLKVHPIYYNAVVRAESNVGAALIESIKTFIVPLLPDSQFILGDKFGLAEILCAPFVIRIYLLVKLGILGEGIEEKMAQVEKWNRWARAILANENVRKTFNYEFEARKAIERIRKIREANKLRANDANANGAKA